MMRTWCPSFLGGTGLLGDRPVPPWEVDRVESSTPGVILTCYERFARGKWRITELAVGAVGFLSQRSKEVKKQRSKEEKSIGGSELKIAALLLCRAEYRTRREYTPHGRGARWYGR